MKKTILFILFLMLLNIIVYGQNPIKPNTNNINNSLDKFVGTWQWAKGSDTLRAVLKKENISVATLNNVHADIIVGFYLFKIGDTIIENSINYNNTNFSDGHYTIIGNNDNGNDTLEARLKEISNNNLKESLSLILSNSPKQLEWKLSPMERRIIFNKKGDMHHNKPKFTLPKKLILSKVE